MNCSIRARIGGPSPAAASHLDGDRRVPVSRSSLWPMASAAPAETGRRRPTGDSFIRLHLRKLSPYQPILPFELRRKPEDIIKLDANENPYGPPPEVAEALGNLKFAYVYPDPESGSLLQIQALNLNTYLWVCGADELID